MLDKLRSKKFTLVILGVAILVVVIAMANQQNQAPIAKASSNVTTGQAPLNVDFSNKGSYDPDDDKLSYSWNFGDNTKSNEANPKKTFDNPGKYIVVLTVKDKEHSTKSKSIAITVTEAVAQTSSTSIVRSESSSGKGHEDHGVVAGTSTSSTPTPVVTTPAASTPTPQSQPPAETGRGGDSSPTPNTGTNPSTNPDTTAPQSPTNLIKNPSLSQSLQQDRPDGWSKGGWGENTTTWTYETTGRTDNSSVSVTVEDYISGHVKWVHEPIAITGGKTYEFKDWYKANVETELVVDYVLADGTHKHEWLADVAPAADWTQVTQTIIAPVDATHVNVNHVLKSEGTLTTDDYSLTAVESTTPAV